MPRLHNQFPVDHAILENPVFKGLPLPAKWLYVILCKLSNRYSNESGFFFRTYDRLQQDASLSREAIRQAIKTLTAVGLIEVSRQPIMRNGKDIKKPANAYKIRRLNTTS